MRLRLTILGCGSSGGVPRIDGDWGECDPNNPRNARLRCALLVERHGADGVTRLLVDTGPDMRAQLLAAQVPDLDGVVITHFHADHVHGIDDLRALVIRRRARLPVYTDPVTAAALRHRFDYLFVQPEGSDYPPILDLHEIGGAFEVQGAGGAIPVRPFEVIHGRINALGLRFGGAAYLPDVSEIPEAVWPALEGLDLWILDCLRREPHPSHVHLARSLEWIARAAPARAVLTNLHVTLDYAALAAETPDHVTPAHDGLVLETKGAP